MPAADQGRQARSAERRAGHHRIPDRRAVVPAASLAVHQESRHHRHRRDVTHRRCHPDAVRAATISISTSPSSGSVFRPRRAIRCARYFSSQAAALKGSQNLAGISNPAIDSLIDIIIAAKDRADLVTACRALDRVLRAGQYWIPQWYKASHWIAYWDVFARPPGKPRFARGVPETWWYDRDRANEIERAG